MSTDNGCLHGMGGATYQSRCPERFPIHRNMRLQCILKRGRGRLVQLSLRVSDFQLFGHDRQHLDISYDYFVFVVSTEA